MRACTTDETAPNVVVVERVAIVVAVDVLTVRKHSRDACARDAFYASVLRAVLSLVHTNSFPHINARGTKVHLSYQYVCKRITYIYADEVWRCGTTTTTMRCLLI